MLLCQNDIYKKPNALIIRKDLTEPRELSKRLQEPLFPWQHNVLPDLGFLIKCTKVASVIRILVMFSLQTKLCAISEKVKTSKKMTEGQQYLI